MYFDLKIIGMFTTNILELVTRRQVVTECEISLIIAKDKYFLHLNSITLKEGFIK